MTRTTASASSSRSRSPPRSRHCRSAWATGPPTSSQTRSRSSWPRRRTSNAPLNILNIVEIPGGLSFLLDYDTDTVVEGLDSVPADERPPGDVVHIAFDVMVGIGFLLLGLGAWFAVHWWRRRAVPENRVFLRLAVAAGPLAVAALEAGWVVTEVGRQPWIVNRVMRVDDAVTLSPNIRIGYFVLLAVYGAMSAATVYVLRRMARPQGCGEMTPR